MAYSHIECKPEEVKPIFFRKKISKLYKLLYLVNIVIFGAGFGYLITHLPKFLQPLAEHPIIAIFTSTAVLVLWVQFTSKIETWVNARYKFVNLFFRNSLPSQGVVVNEQGIYCDKQALHIPWHNVDMVTAEVTEIHPEDMILNACLHIHYRGGQTFIVTTDYKDYDEVFEGICAAFQLHNAQAQLTELYYEEQSGCCTKLWQRG